MFCFMFIKHTYDWLSSIFNLKFLFLCCSVFLISVFIELGSQVAKAGLIMVLVVKDDPEFLNFSASLPSVRIKA